MPTFNTMDGPLVLEPSDDLLYDVQNALTFWYAYGRHPYRALSGARMFMITPEDFRYVDRSQFWRFTREQTEEIVQVLWPDEYPSIMRIFRQSRPVVD